MPLTALHETGQVQDATVCDDSTWAQLHKTAPRAKLTCRDCGGAMHAKVSPKGLRFFAHDVRAASCESLGESVEHLELKRLIAQLIRTSGNEAVIEATPGPNDQGGWRADVLGIAPTGNRVAFEVQLAAMTVEEGQERTARYAADQINTVWVSTRHAHWISQLPSCRLDMAQDCVLTDRGLARYQARDPHDDPSWRPAEPVPFRKVVAGLLKGSITTVTTRYHAEQVGGRTKYIRDATLLVSTQDLRRHTEEEGRRLQEREPERRDKEAREAHLKALYERQERVLQHVLREATRSGTPPANLWLGVPPTPWDGRLPAALRVAVGNPSTARGAAVWTGTNPQELTLRAVVCPVANQASEPLGRSWLKRQVQVFVEDQREAARVARALNWPTNRLTISPNAPTANT